MTPGPPAEETSGEVAFMARPKRWSVPYSADMKPEMVDALLAVPPFSTIDARRFPERLPLSGILLNDCRVTEFKTDEIIVRQGDYGHSAFLILTGMVRVILGELPADVLGHRSSRKPGFWRHLARAFRPPAYPEVRRSHEAKSSDNQKTGTVTGVFLQDVPGVLNQYKMVQLKAGEIFGELAALSRTPRTSTIVADGPVRLLEIRWQGLRDVRRHAPEWKDHIDSLYRERSLLSHLRETPILRHLSEDALKEVGVQTRFETHGSFDWNTTMLGNDVSHAERLAREPIIHREGEYPNGLLLIRGGFARLSERYNHGERTVSYLGKGGCFGLAEIAHNWQNPGATTNLRQTLRAVGYVDTLFIPTTVVEQLILPTLPPAEFERLPAVFLPGPPGRDPASSNRLDTDMLEFFVQHRFINGTATMLIDMDRCTRCDDCVRACAANHDNNPRFIRQGPVWDGVMVAQACMHCVDPVCMIGCPTGAIHRDSAQGEVVINHETCIGCGTCANGCPYHNIQMVAMRDQSGRHLVDHTTQTPIMQAKKCDLCIDDPSGPACVRACPHDALTRTDMNDAPTLAAWLNR
jgi:Fe-S-cluster-containing dehydrogenase component/CRP-like cAMP-binding protein